MSEFWNNNKDSIKSGVLAAGKYGYQGTKFVAKTGYKAGKSQYDKSKGKREGRASDDSDNSGHSTPNVNLNYQDPTNFPPPPTKPGQLQYRSTNTSLGTTNNSNYSLPQQTQQPEPVLNPISSVPPNQQYERAMMPLPSNPSSEHQGQQQGLPNTRPQPQIPAQQQLPNNSIQQQQYAPPPQEQQQYAPPTLQQQQYAPPPDQQQYMSTQVHSNQQNMHSEQQSFGERPIQKQGSGPYQNSGSAHSSTPHFEVKPFDPDDPANKPKIEIPQVDVNNFAPPPSHQDRTTLIRPKKITPVSSGSSTPANKSSVISREGTGPKKTDPNRSSNHINSTEQPRAAIVGKFDDKIDVGFAPPPKPFKRTELRHSNEKISIDLNTTKPAPPYNAQGAEAAPPPPARAQDESTTNRDQLEEPITNSSIVGAYKENIEIGFAPPPKPFRRNESGSINNGKNISPVPPTEKNTNAIPPSLPSRTGRPNTTNSKNGAKNEPVPRAAIVGQFHETAVNFAPPPRPFRRTETDIEKRQPSSLNSSASPGNRDAAISTSEATSFQTAEPQRDTTTNTDGKKGDINEMPPPPKPFRKNDGPSPVSKSNPATTMQPITMTILDDEYDDEYDLQNDKIEPIQSFDKTELLASIKNKKKPAPKPAPKPKNLSSNIDKSSRDPNNMKSNSPTVIPRPNESNMLPISSFPPPPKPLRRSTREVRVNSEEEPKGIDKGPKSIDDTPKIHTNSKKQPPPIAPRKANSSGKPAPPVPRKKASLGDGDAESSTDSDDNPFSKYLKDAVPTESDRLHKS
ncbi:hypothetical protein RNJ44_03838 [Nakaseomyces bracarensis]|uniref:Altered inheritance of mitochondria protein 3 n=1 Tax=Nakaseomyces bracarensis TaxID=273131 RepID=A0ABR4NYH2_9SACH